MTKTRKVWAIYYTIRVNSKASWVPDWVGPCGVGITHRANLSSYDYDCLSYRPFFFRTRALARQRAKELTFQANKNWKWCKHTVRPIMLSWTEGD